MTLIGSAKSLSMATCSVFEALFPFISFPNLFYPDRIVTEFNINKRGIYHWILPIYLEYFALLENKDPIWDRILYIDIKIQSDKRYRNVKLFNRLKRKQKRNREYIISQFESPAIKHFSREIEKGLEE